ncbi:uncharacterized protein LOC133905993 [Phragmites australis]|uniref:uncharacterized protein LOC133905993 n=1 Tax=Phragmites australis TaxID=29695 RepID=UPI002D78F223|nr:uncharacterized protein LOC133905993 [Phragmites australis]
MAFMYHKVMEIEEKESTLGNKMKEDHKSDADYLNRSLEHYGEMVTIFRNSMAIRKFTKGSNEALGTEDGETEIDDVDANMVSTTPKDNGASSSTSKPNNARTTVNEDEGLIAAFKSIGEKLAKAIVKADTVDKDVPDDLRDNLNSLPGFEETHISFYYAHLIANPHIARAFNKLPFNHKLNWVAMYISEKFSRC